MSSAVVTFTVRLELDSTRGHSLDVLLASNPDLGTRLLKKFLDTEIVDDVTGVVMYADVDNDTLDGVSVTWSNREENNASALELF